MATEKAAFAAGCFWHVEVAFRNVKGVKDVVVGFMGGKTLNPAYKDVCTGKTGHAETALVTFDPEVVSYGKLLGVFWSIHDPTQLNRQGPDVGSNYRSAIFCYNDKQMAAAIASRDKLQKSSRYKDGKIVTELAKASAFYKAEDYHQRYLEKRGLATCPA